MKRWQKPIIAFVALKLNPAIFSSWTYQCTFNVTDGDTIPYMKDERGVRIITASQCLHFCNPYTREHIEITIGKGWLRKHLTPKQFADFAIERIMK